jgi:hypothetical protein
MSFQIVKPKIAAAASAGARSRTGSGPITAASSSSWSRCSVHAGHGTTASGPITVSGMPL